MAAITINDTIKSLINGNLGLKDVRCIGNITSNCIDTVSHNISYEEFLLKYLLPNRPCLLENWATFGWKSINRWVDSAGRADLQYLNTSFGNTPECDCNIYSARYHT